MNYRYWNSDCFLSWLKQIEDRVEALGAVIKEAEAGKLKIVTSALTIAEVIYLDRDSLPGKEDAETIRRFFEQPWILIVNVDRDTMERAVEAVLDKGIHPKDAIHVGSALDVGAKYFDTYDQTLINRAKDYPLEVGPPQLPEQLELTPPEDG